MRPKGTIGPPSSAELHAAGEKRLGALVAPLRADFQVLEPRGDVRRIPTAVVIAGLGLAAALPLITIVVVKALTGSGIAFLCGVIVLGAEAAALWFAGWQARRPRPGQSMGSVVYQFERGFVCAGDRPEAFRWADLPVVYASDSRLDLNGFYSHTNYLYSLITVDGRRVNFFGSETEGSPSARTDIEPWTRVLVEEVVHRRRLPAVVAAVDAGQAVAFDDITVSRDGIITSSDLIAWSLITGVRVSDGKLTIRAAGRRPFTHMTADIPNVGAFLGLVYRLAPPSSTRHR